MSEPTEQQIAEAAAYWRSPLGRADRLKTRADRLFRLVKLGAPPLVVESARLLVAESIASFPADLEAMQQLEEAKAAIQQDETEALKKAGYFDEALGGLKGPTP